MNCKKLGIITLFLLLNTLFAYGQEGSESQIDYEVVNIEKEEDQLVSDRIDEEINSFRTRFLKFGKGLYDDIHDNISNNSTSIERVLLDLTSASSFSDNRYEVPLRIPENFSSTESSMTQTGSYYDDFSGFQAFKTDVSDFSSGRLLKVYTIASTQLFMLNDKGDIEDTIDKRDWYTNLGFGLPQIESVAAARMLEDVQKDLSHGYRVYISGQSLGGMVSHALGYISYKKYEEIYGNKPTNLRVMSFGLAGMKQTIAEYYKKFHGKKDYQLDEEGIEKYFTSVFFKLDVLPRIGDHFGKLRVLDPKFLIPTEFENYSMNLPFLKKYLEAHLYAGFDRALKNNSQTENYVSRLPERKQIYHKGAFKLSRKIGYRLLKKKYLKKLSKEQTEKDHLLCYNSDSWMTNINMHCTNENQLGCKVGERYEYHHIKINKKTGRERHSRNKRSTAKWCLVNDKSNSILKAKLKPF